MTDETHYKMKETIAVLSDLFFEAKIRTVAKNLGVPLVIIKDKEAFLKELEKNNIEKLIIDLNFKGFNVLFALKELNSIYSFKILGYLSHVEHELRREAKKYCDIVVTRNEFSETLPDILKKSDSLP